MKLSSLAIALFFASSTSTAIAEEVAFSYDPDSATGPAYWGDLNLEDNQCDGESNSPIDVQTFDCDVFASYMLREGTCNIGDLDYVITKNGPEVNFPKDKCRLNQMRMPGIPGTFEASHFHVRTSSEHTIDGQHSGAELHVVHNQVNGGDRQAVFAFMIQPGAQYDNPYFNYLLDGWTEALLDNRSKCGYIDFDRKRNLHEEQREDRRKLQAFNVYDFVPSSAGFYQYDGGLTEPPCSEVVWWNLADAPLYISIKQFNELINLTLGYVDLNTCLNGSIASPSGSTSRPVQPLNGRRVTRICPAERRPGGAATTARQVGKQKAGGKTDKKKTKSKGDDDPVRRHLKGSK